MEIHLNSNLPSIGFLLLLADISIHLYIFIAMLGTTEQRGVMVLSLEKLFTQVEQHKEYVTKVTISYVEVYNENIRDLLIPSGNHLHL